jgi:predicted pyridoxine 5'-phosphate oxidase superfamily flavin-nucleotide-binding protein
MTRRFAGLMFSAAAKAMQTESGSRAAYARLVADGALAVDSFSDTEADFIAARDSFYIATVTEDGWPYVQHRGGQPGFLQVLDGRTLGFVEYRGNKQFITLGNLATDDRVSLFLMDYPNRRRLKILGHASRADRGAAIVAKLRSDQAWSNAVIIRLEAFDWNCPQYITPRYTAAEIAERSEHAATLR